MTKDVIAAILERRSTRRFKSEAVPEATIGRLVDAARWAPSAGNVQPWKFYVVRNREMKEKLAAAALGQKFVAEAPVVLVVCAWPEQAKDRFGARGEQLYCVQDTAAAVQNILLAAAGYGLGTCWVGAFSEDAVRTALELPPHLRPVAIVPVGYAAGTSGAPGRKSLDEIVVVVD